MQDISLMCNYPGCKKSISQFAHVTTCSHLFCYEHGQEISSNGTKKCPNCSIVFESPDDLQGINLCPTETTKSLILAGLPPDTIMEISQKALSFWTYQFMQKQLFLESSLKNTTTNLDIMRNYCENMEMQHNSEIQALRRKLTSIWNKSYDSISEEMDTFKKRCEELVIQLSDKSRAFNKLKSQHEMLRRTLIPKVHSPNETNRPEIKMSQNMPSFNLISFHRPASNSRFVFNPSNTQQ